VLLYILASNLAPESSLLYSTGSGERCFCCS